MARKEIIWEPEYHSPTPYPKIEGWEEDIVETAGFIPLEVRFKQMEQAGYRARFFESEFSSHDISDMFLNHPEFDLTAEDDMEEAMEKIQLRQAYIDKVKQEVLKRRAAESKVEEETKSKTKPKEEANENV